MNVALSHFAPRYFLPHFAANSFLLRWHRFPAKQKKNYLLIANPSILYWGSTCISEEWHPIRQLAYRTLGEMITLPLVMPCHVGMGTWGIPSTMVRDIQFD